MTNAVRSGAATGYRLDHAVVDWIFQKPNNKGAFALTRLGIRCSHTQIMDVDEDSGKM